MTEYLIKSGICMVLFFGLYRLLLRKEKMFSFTRFYLIFSILFSLSIPFITLPVNLGIAKLPDVIAFNRENQPWPNSTEDELTLSPSDKLTFMDAVTDPGTVSVSAPEPEAPVKNAKRWLFFAYLSGVIIMSIRFCRNIILIFLMSRRSEKIYCRWYKIALVDSPVNPFTFIRTIFLYKQDYSTASIAPNVIKHELEHVKQAHSADIIFFEVLQIIFWFNPILLMYKQAVRMNHEFLADEAVIRSTRNVATYAGELVNFIGRRLNVSFASGFSPSAIRLRLMMISRTDPAKALKKKRYVLAGLSLAVIGLAFTITPTYTGIYQGKKLTDADGNTYRTMILGDKVFMAENLRTTKYNDGTAIPLITDSVLWNEYRQGYSWYDNDESNKEKFGALYNWYAVNTGKLCPAGWHVPSNKEFYYYLNKYIDHFTLAGFRGQHGNFQYSGESGVLWSSSEVNQYVAASWYQTSGNRTLYPFPYSKRTGASVRCIRNYSERIDSGALLKAKKESDIITEEVFFIDHEFKPLKSMAVIDRKIMKPGEMITIQPARVKSIDLLTGRKARQKYGRQAKNGVVEIITYGSDKSTVADTMNYKPYYTYNEKLPEGSITIPVSDLYSVSILTYPVMENQADKRRWKMIYFLSRDYFRVGGQVLNEAGESMTGVTVTASDRPVEAVTDSQGRFLLKDINPGSKIRLVADGYDPIDVKASQYTFRTDLVINFYKSDKTDLNAGADLIDFSGKWKYNSEQSNGSFPAIKDETYEISQYNSDSINIISSLTAVGFGNKIMEHRNARSYLFNKVKTEIQNNLRTVTSCRISSDGLSFSVTTQLNSIIGSGARVFGGDKRMETYSLSEDGSQLIVRQFIFQQNKDDKPGSIPVSREIRRTVFDRI